MGLSGVYGGGQDIPGRLVKVLGDEIWSQEGVDNSGGIIRESSGMYGAVVWCPGLTGLCNSVPGRYR